MQETRGSKIEKECQEREKGGEKKEYILSQEKWGFGLGSSKRENNERERQRIFWVDIGVF